jgi:hypothetical protein
VGEGGKRNRFILLEGFQTSPSRLSDKGGMKVVLLLRYKARLVNPVKQSLFIVRTIRHTQIHSVYGQNAEF